MFTDKGIQTETSSTGSIASEKDGKMKSVHIELKEDDRIVPVVIFAFRDAERVEDETCDEGIGVNVQPIDNAVRVLIRSDISKEQAIDILTKIITVIEHDCYDWGFETDCFLENFRREVEKKNRKLVAQSN